MQEQQELSIFCNSKFRNRKSNATAAMIYFNNSFRSATGLTSIKTHDQRKQQRSPEQLSEDCLLEQAKDCHTSQNPEAAVGDVMPCRIKVAKIMQKLQIIVILFPTFT